MPVDNGVSKGRQRYKNCVKKKLGNGSTINGTSSLNINKSEVQFFVNRFFLKGSCHMNWGWFILKRVSSRRFSTIKMLRWVPICALQARIKFTSYRSSGGIA